MKVTLEFDETALANALMKALVAAGGNLNVAKVGDVAVASTTAPADDTAKKKAAADAAAKKRIAAEIAAKKATAAKAAEDETVGDGEDDWGDGDDAEKAYELVDVRNALQAYSTAHDKVAAKAILVEVGGSAGLSTLDESKFKAVIEALAV